MPKCGATTRKGGKCQREALPGKRRCALHGGKSTGPKNQRGNKNAAKPGSLYSQFLTAEERKIAACLELGSVDEELRLTRIRLMRALQLEQERGDTLELVETVERSGGGPMAAGDEEKRQVKDYATLIDRLTGRIESLELRRVQILAIQADTDLKLGKNARDGEMHQVDVELKRLEITKTAKELENPDEASPTPVRVVVEVKDARRYDDAQP
ncbi:HGGxSTG domain-containing protein [Aquitalea aquatica]|uniref:Uncharacterized protein n=1 Tax=Aquitalea aquatica TaxID=3044273 RepID=A0A838Y772_9NEIS|nr:HGGxSTG domain-containing protein [Aquitalea magnusonii]MBA4710536.1 hypothetical protein [Aquitalea magnusonii]